MLISDLTESLNSAYGRGGIILTTNHMVWYVKLDVVQRWLGHASLATTQRYLHSRVDQNAVFDKMNAEVA